MSQTSHEVQLAIYDLSQGMARTLSAQFLGPAHALDIIPHTAIVVYGREYYFGGGIQSADPNEFRRSMGIFPIEIQSLGRTDLNRTDFERWCQEATRTGRYSPEAYDLIQRNCNNFSHDAATEGLRLPRGVPDWILDVPRRFLSSPMGQMVRPMLEQMQVTGAGPRGGGGGAGMGGGGMNAPFANTGIGANQFGAGGTAATAPAPATRSTPSAASNPWANIPSNPTPTAVATEGAKSPPAEQVRETKEEDAGATVVPTPILDSHNRPLLSNDAKTVNICVAKLNGGDAMSDAHKAALDQLSKVLTAGNKPTDATVEEASSALLPHLSTGGSTLVFALMLLRLVVLHPPKEFDPESSFAKCLGTVGANLISTDETNPYRKSPAARSMGWCTLSNYHGVAITSTVTSPPTLEECIDTAVMDVSVDHQPRVEVRQSAAAFLYNVAHSLTASSSSGNSEEDEVPDTMVTLLCGSLEGLTDETDGTAQLRRLLVTAKIVKAHDGAKSLVTDLGFGDAISSFGKIERKKASGSVDAGKAVGLAKELEGLLSSTRT